MFTFRAIPLDIS